MMLTFKELLHYLTDLRITLRWYILSQFA
jgi:hypothetical protein